MLVQYNIINIWWYWCCRHQPHGSQDITHGWCQVHIHWYSRYIIYVVPSTICVFDSNPLIKWNPFDKQYLSTWFFNQRLHLSGISVAKISVTWGDLFVLLPITGARIFCRNQMRPLRWSCQRLQPVQVQINMELSVSLEPNKSWLSEYLWENLICHRYMYM